MIIIRKETRFHRPVEDSAFEVLEFVPAFLASFFDDLGSLLEEFLQFRGPLLHLLLESTHCSSSTKMESTEWEIFKSVSAFSKDSAPLLLFLYNNFLTRNRFLDFLLLSIKPFFLNL